MNATHSRIRDALALVGIIAGAAVLVPLRFWLWLARVGIDAGESYFTDWTRTVS